MTIGALQWAVGAFCTLIGVLMLVTPHHFGATYAALRPDPTGWGAVFFLAGAALFGVAALAPRRWLVVVVHLLAGAMLLLLATSFVAVSFWDRALNYAVVGLGTAVAPLLPQAADRRWGGRCDLFALLMGIASSLTGILILASPDPFSASAAGPAQGWYGLAFLASGLALAASQLLPSLPRAASPVAHLLAAAAFSAYLTALPLPLLPWSVIGYYGGFGAVLALLPWLGRRLALVDPASLRTRLALALAVAAALPLTVGLALEVVREGRSVRGEALAVQQARAAALARHVADSLELHRAALTILAARPGLADLDLGAQRTLLRSFTATYPAFVAVSMDDVAGRPVAGSDDPPVGAMAGVPRFEDARPVDESSLSIQIPPLVDRPVLVLRAPLHEPDGRFAGLVVGVLAPDGLDALLQRTGVDTGGEAYLVDGGGRVVAHPDRSLDDRSGAQPVAALLAADDRPGSLSYKTRAGEWLAGYARVPGLDWGVVHERPASAALASTHAANDRYLGILLLFIGAAAILGMLAARWLAAPLGTLADAVDTLEAGDATAPLPQSRISEVAHLANAFGDMRDRLAARTEERARAEQERVRLIEEIERERATLAEVMASMTDGLLVVNSAHQIRYCNARAGALLGIDPLTLLGRHAETAFAMLRRSLTDTDTLGATAKRALDGLEARPTCEVSVIGPPRRDVLVQLFPVADIAGTGLGVGMLLHDMTAERDLQRTKDELVAVVSHELRTPLSSVVGFAELLLMREWAEAERRQFLGVMVTEGRRLATLVNEFLDLQRMESSRELIVPVPTDLRPVLKRSVASAGDDPQRPVVLDPDADLPPVQADADRVQQVLTNLLSNARKYSPDGGEVLVAARAVDGVVEVSVSDRGLGIPPEALPRLFEKFYRVDNSDHRAIMGTGLGLAIVKKIIEAHGGRVWAESPGPGQGACFGFTLPLAEASPSSPDVPVAEHERAFAPAGG